MNEKKLVYAYEGEVIKMRKDRDALVRYVRAQRNYLGERYLDRAPHFIVTEHEEAYEALSQELRDEIEDGGEKTDQS